MKTLFIDSNSRDLMIFRQFSKKKITSLTNSKWMPFHVWLSQFKTASMSTDLKLFHLYKKLQPLTSAFPIYGKMFQYPQFVDQVVRFASDLVSCCEYKEFLDSSSFDHIMETLPSTSSSEKELKELLKLCLDDHDLFPFSSCIPSTFSTFENLATTNQFHLNIFDSLVHTKFIENGLPIEPMDSVENPTFTYRHALNQRLEIESIAQEIVNENYVAEDILIITLDPSYDNLLEHVFNQYHIPYGFTQRSHFSSLFESISARIQLHISKDIDSLIYALEINAFPFECSSTIQHYVQSYICNLSELLEPSTRIHDCNPTLLTQQEYQLRLHEENEFNEFLPTLKPFIEKVLQLFDPKEICEDIFNQCVLMSDKSNQRDSYQCKSILEDLYSQLDSIEDLNLVVYLLDNQQLSTSSSCLGNIAITPSTLPVPARKIAYIIGSNQKNYPGFTPKTGIFDEHYLTSTPYPSMQQRYTTYLNQLDWIKHCADTIHFTYSLLDYQGKKSESSFEIESFVSRSVDLKCTSSDIPLIEQHQLSSEYASALFLKDNRLFGSISSFETHFKCPYSYFLKYGLRVSDFTYSDLTSNTIGTIQHAILEESCNRYGKKYASLNKEEMLSIGQPYLESLLTLFPKQVGQVHLIYKKMIDNLLTTFEFLKDMESNTEFTPTHCEFKFTSDFFESLTIRGMIDRLDICGDLLRIIDYKSSNYSLSEDLVKSGVQLQLCTYYILASHLFDKEVAGAYYCSLRNENIDIPAALVKNKELSDWSDTDTKNEFIKLNQLSGWTFLESEFLDFDAKHIKNIKLTKNGLSFKLYDKSSIEDCLTELYQLLYSRLNSGLIVVDPIENACTYCNYKPICRFKGQARKANPLVSIDQPLKNGGSSNEVE